MNRSRLRRYTPLRSHSFARGGTLMRRTSLRPVSARRAIRLKEYYRRRERFLARPENQWCIVMWVLFGVKVRTCEIHHKRGRIGPNLLDESTWMAVSREGHRWIHDHPAEARSRGWLG